MSSIVFSMCIYMHVYDEMLVYAIIIVIIIHILYKFYYTNKDKKKKKEQRWHYTNILDFRLNVYSCYVCVSLS